MAPSGGWPSPIPIELLTAGRVSLAEVRFDGPGALVSIESFGSEPADRIEPMPVEGLDARRAAPEAAARA